MLKFTIDKSALVAATRACAGIVPKSGAHAVYQSLHIRGMPGQPLAFSATDLETGIALLVTALVEESGLAVLPAAALAALAAKLPDGDVRIEVDQETYRGTVRAGKGKFTLAGHAPADFPELPAPDKSRPVVLPAARVATAFGRVAHAMAKERMRFALTGVLVASKGGRIEFVATDARRLALDAMEAPEAAEFSVVVGANGVEQVIRICDAAGEGATVAISTSGNHFFAATERESVVTRVCEGSFPNYHDAIPKAEKSRLIVNRADLIAALERSALVDQSEATIVRLETVDGELVVASKSPERETLETVAGDFGGASVWIGFNGSLLGDALKACEAETVTIQLDGAAFPAVIREAAMIQVVMPVTLDEAKKPEPAAAGAAK